MYPACATDEYASILFGLVEPNAATLPHVIVITERVASVYNQIALSSAPASGRAITSSTLINPIIPIAFDAVARTPATGEFAPAYASGAAKWNGAALTLNPNPTKTNPRARVPRIVESAQFAAIVCNCRLPNSK